VNSKCGIQHVAAKLWPQNSSLAGLSYSAAPSESRLASSLALVTRLRTPLSRSRFRLKPASCRRSDRNSIYFSLDSLVAPDHNQLEIASPKSSFIHRNAPPPEAKLQFRCSSRIVTSYTDELLARHRRLSKSLRHQKRYCDVLQVVSIAEPAESQRGNRHSFSRPQGSGQTHRVGLSKASGLLGLWFHGICNSRNRITTASGERSDCGLGRYGGLGVLMRSRGV